MNLYDVLAEQGATHFERLFSQKFAGGTVQTLTGQPPLSFKADGTPLISWSMLGNGQQSGTPSPQNIVPFDGTGERTGNLFDDAVYSAYKQTDGTYLGTVNNFYTTHVTPFTSDDIGKTFTFTIVVKGTTSTNVRASANVNGVVINGNNLSAAGTTTVTFTVSSVNDYLYLGYGGGGVNQITLADIMLNSGSTALPYEPYGYKIPLTCAGQTTPLYLGEVSTTRRVRKLVFDGTESWSTSTTSSGDIAFRFNFSPYAKDQSSAISSHYINSTQGGTRFFIGSGLYAMFFVDESYETIADWKSHLASEYAAGHPVIVWYVLAEPETAIVNEPLAKIGDYADELHSEDAGVSIPTAKGQNTLTVDTELQPSSMTITFK